MKWCLFKSMYLLRHPRLSYDRRRICRLWLNYWEQKKKKNDWNYPVVHLLWMITHFKRTLGSESVILWDDLERVEMKMQSHLWRLMWWFRINSEISAWCAHLSAQMLQNLQRCYATRPWKSLSFPFSELLVQTFGDLVWKGFSFALVPVLCSPFC